MMVFSGVTVFVTAVGVFFVARTLEATRDAVRATAAGTAAAADMARISHEQFVAAHRPRLRDRFTQAAPLILNHQAKAWVTFANVGQTDATILEFGADIAIRTHSRGWLPPGVYASPEEIEPVTLTAGAQHYFPVTSHAPMDSEAIASICTAQGMFGAPYKLVLIGGVMYVDSDGAKYHTSFYRTYNWDSEEFERADADPDHEYED